MTSPTSPAGLNDRSALWWRLVRFPLDVLVVSVIVLEDAARPLYRPLGRWISQIRLMRAIEGGVASLPPYAALVALAIPFAVAEPLKIAGLYWMGTGHKLLGLATLALAYGASFVIVDRVYHAGRPQLLTIGWFASFMTFAANIKDSMMQRLRASRLWMLGQDLALSAKSLIRRRLGRERNSAAEKLDHN